MIVRLVVVGHPRSRWWSRKALVIAEFSVGPPSRRSVCSWPTVPSGVVLSGGFAGGCDAFWRPDDHVMILRAGWCGIPLTARWDVYGTARWGCDPPSTDVMLLSWLGSVDLGASGTPDLEAALDHADLATRAGAR
jgi:hypothetical protein